MQSIFWFLVWLLLFGGVSTPATPVASDPPPMVEAVLDEPFTLAYDGSATLDDGSLTITFDRIVEDSRCPLDVNCFWSGHVIVALRVEADGAVGQMVELGGITDSDGVLRPPRPELPNTPTTVIGNYTLELLAVTPYPAHADALPTEGEYTLSLVVHSPAEPKA